MSETNVTHDQDAEPEAQVRPDDQAASGVPRAGWAIGDRFSWEEIHQRLLASADEEISSSVRELFFSGLTAGFAIVLTFIGYAVGRAQFGDNSFGAALLFPIGFMYIILGRYQLYTENTLPPVKLVMTRMASIPLLLRVWGVVLLGNVTGAALGAAVLAHTDVLSPEASRAGYDIALHGYEMGGWTVFFKALFAGWLVAGVVWLGTAARDTISRVVLVYVTFYTIAVTGLFHVVSATCEVLFAVFRGQGPGLVALLEQFWLPALFGNTVGGVMVFAFMAYAQSEQQRYPEVRVLSLRDVLFSWKGGRPFDTPRPNPPWTDGED